MNDDTDNLGEVVDRILEELESTWNAGDAAGFAAHFTPDADFVDVLGRIFRGRDVIARLHQRNFETIHAGSHLKLERLATRMLDGGVALAHVKGAVRVPSGPLAGSSLATQTMVLVNGAGVWRIRAFHNTFVRDMPGIPDLDG